MQPKRVIVSDTLGNEMFLPCLTQGLDIHVERLREEEFRYLIALADRIGCFTTNPLLFQKIQKDNHDTVCLYRNEVALDNDTLLIVTSNNPYAPYTLYSTTQTLEGYARTGAIKVWREYAGV